MRLLVLIRPRPSPSTAGMRTGFEAGGLPLRSPAGHQTETTLSRDLVQQPCRAAGRAPGKTFPVPAPRGTGHLSPTRDAADPAAPTHPR